MKEIKYNRHTKDYDMIFAGDYIGSARTYYDAELRLNEHAYECLLHGLLPTDLELAADAADYNEAMGLTAVS